MFKVYCLKNKDKIVYIGYTKRSLHDRWRSHKNSHPERVNLLIELIQEVETKDDAKSLELMFIKQYNTLVPNGLNISLGHANHDGSRLLQSGVHTRFGNRKKYEGEELRRKSKAAVESSKVCSKPIKCLNTGTIYPSLRACAKALGLSSGNLSQVLKGKRPHTKGLKFIYVCPIKILSD